MNPYIKPFVAFAVLALASTSLVANEQAEYTISVEVLAMEEVVMGSHTIVTPRKCEDKFNHVTGTAYTECTGGDARTIEEKETRFRTKLTGSEVQIVEIVCSIKNVFQDCLDLRPGSRHQARWKGEGLLAIAYQNRKGKMKEVMYEVRPATSTQSQNAGGESVCKLTSVPEHANILIDGDFVGQTPADLKLTSGKHKIEVDVVGYRSYTQTLTAIPGSTVTLNVILEKQ